jgi:plasmid maintenance system antidote protein VapI
MASARDPLRETQQFEAMRDASARRSHPDGILAGTTKITKKRAAGLGQLPCGPSAAFWLALEHNYRVGLAAGKVRA